MKEYQYYDHKGGNQPKAERGTPSAPLQRGKAKKNSATESRVFGEGGNLTKKQIDHLGSTKNIKDSEVNAYYERDMRGENEAEGTRYKGSSQKLLMTKGYKKIKKN